MLEVALDELTMTARHETNNKKNNGPAIIVKPPTRRRMALYVASILLIVTTGHYLLPENYYVLHNFLQRLYYIPIVWTAYHYGKKGGLLVSVISGLLYLPHVLIGWKEHPEYQANQIIEIALFLVIGVTAGILFEQKTMSQKLLQSYEKMALFGSLSRSIIKSLKNPLRAIKGMVIALEPMGKRDAALASCFQIIEEEVSTMENMRNDLIALVERKKLRLKKQNLTDIMYSFMSQVETGLGFKGVKVRKLAKETKLTAHVNRNALVNTLHQLVGTMVDKGNGVEKLTVYTEQSSSYVWLGAAIEEIRLDSYYRSDLSVLNSQYYHEYELISVINVMNNHFGDVRFRWQGNQLVEFILVFPKKLKLPWYLRDEQSNNGNKTKHAKAPAQ